MKKFVQNFAALFAQYLAIYKNENEPNRMEKFLKKVQHFAKY